MSNSNTKSHVLLTLGVLFTIGGVTRFLPSTFATAEDSRPPEQAGATIANHSAPMKTEAEANAASLRPTTPSPQEVCFSGEMASLLSEDSDRLDRELTRLTEKELSLQEWQAELTAQTAELKALRETLETRWNDMQQESESDIAHLSQMYGSMKPDQAALIFDKMDPAFAAGFLRELSSDQAGLILANMNTEKAYVVSLKLASMNDDIRKAAKPT